MNSINTRTNDQWQDYKFSDLCKITRGASPRPIHEWVTQSGGMPWVKISDATASNSRYLSKTKEQIKLDSVRMSVQVHPGDLIVSNSATPGIPKFLTIDACIHDGWLLLRDIKDTTTKEYLYYLLVSIREGLLQLGNGSIFTNLKTDILKNYPVKIPSKDVQSLIWKTLSFIDDKIDLLHAQNETFEKLAQALFSGRFVSLKNDNWTKSTLNDVISVKGGTTPSTSVPSYWDGKYNWTSPRDLSNSRSPFMTKTEKTITEDGLKQIGSGLLPKGTVLLSSRAPIGYLAISDIEVAINQGYIAVVCDKKISNLYMYLWIKQNLDTIINAANGSTFLEISKSTFKSLEFILPPDELLKSFDQQVSPMFEKIRNNVYQINTLIELRNKLLPKLMNGEIELK